MLFFALFGGVPVVFYQLLLLDIGYNCDLNDTTKDCFEYKLWDAKRFSNDPIDCNSAAVQNGTVDVVCYKLILNAGLDLGAVYGTFKMFLVVLNLATNVMLMIKQAKTICKIRTILALLYVGFLAAVVAVQTSPL